MPFFFSIGLSDQHAFAVFLKKKKKTRQSLWWKLYNVEHANYCSLTPIRYSSFIFFPGCATFGCDISTVCACFMSPLPLSSHISTAHLIPSQLLALSCLPSCTQDKQNEMQRVTFETPESNLEFQSSQSKHRWYIWGYNFLLWLTSLFTLSHLVHRVLQCYYERFKSLSCPPPHFGPNCTFMADTGTGNQLNQST